MQRSLRPGMFGLMLIASGGGHAMSIGDIQVESGLGEPFRASVPVSLDESVPPESDCFALAGESRRHPDLAKARVALVNRGDRHVVTISGVQPTEEPILDLSLRAQGCGPTMQRDFVVLLSPRANAVVELAVVTAQAAPSPPPPPTPAGVPAKRRPAGSSRVAGGGRAAARPPATPGAPRPATRPPQRNVNYVLRLDYGFDAFSLAAERIARQRQAEHAAGARPGAAAGVAQRGQAVPLEQVPYTQGGSAPAGGVPTQAAAPATGGDVLVVQNAPDGQGGLPAGASEVAGGTAGSGQVGAAAGQAGSGGGMAAAGSGGSTGGATLPTPGKRAAGDVWHFFTPLNLLWLLLALLFAAALALWLKKRAPASRFMAKGVRHHIDASHYADDETASVHPLPVRRFPSAELARPASAGSEPEERPSAAVETAATAKADDLDADREPAPLMPIFAPAEELSIEVNETPDHILELAEVMLAFGRSNEAIQTLSQYIQGHPRQAVEPWLRLLDMYRQSGLRAEFEALSKDLHQSFNVAIPDWETFDQLLVPQTGVELHPEELAAPAPMSLESLPHILARVTSLWGTPECLDYLDKLLADNRGGQRLGFALPIVRDILLLRDMLRLLNPPPTLKQSFR